MKKIVLASGNAKKIAELTAILAAENIAIVPQHIFNVSEVEETGTTFVENAIIKARHAAKISQLPAIADDSGICVPALGGAPGVYSARYSGKGDKGNNEKLVRELAGKDDKRAFYVCVIVYVEHANDPLPLIATGIWHGEVLDVPRGEGGFGYDPHFLPIGSQKTAAELTASEKNAISHRAMALADFAAQYQARKG